MAKEIVYDLSHFFFPTHRADVVRLALLCRTFSALICNLPQSRLVSLSRQKGHYGSENNNDNNEKYIPARQTDRCLLCDKTSVTHVTTKLDAFDFLEYFMETSLLLNRNVNNFSSLTEPGEKWLFSK